MQALRNIILSSLLLLLAACQSNDRLAAILNAAGENRAELTKVLNRYRGNPADSLKYRAACFLIENMPSYHYYTGKLLDDYAALYQALSQSFTPPAEIADSIRQIYGEFSYSQLTRHQDLLTVDSAYLVNNIEWAFKVWQEQPWGKNVTFDNFCEYILPYRVGDETLAYWREELYHKYQPVIDSIARTTDCSDPLVAAKAISEYLALENRIFFTLQIPSMPHAGARTTTTWKSGTCRELADCLLYVSRALGIPCGLDRMELVGNWNAGHFWNFFLDSHGNSRMVEFPNVRLRLPETFVEPKCKIHRITFSLNRELQQQIDALSTSVPPVFRNPHYRDVTPIYAGRLGYDLSIPSHYLYPGALKEKIVYLCLSNRQDWTPIAWTKVEKSGICFRDVEGSAVFRVAAYADGKLQFLSNPIVVQATPDSLPTTTLLACNGEKEEQVLFYKSTVMTDSISLKMLGGVFEGSNQSDFSLRDTLYQITEVPHRLFTQVDLSSEKKYRYVRYRGADSCYCNISEVAFYDGPDSIPLRGKIIGTPGSRDGKHEYTQVFDGDPYTSFDYKLPSGGWSGLDLGRPTAIRRLVYTPRNHDNHIRKGDRYELFYFDKNWVSVGGQIAGSDSLVYRDVPKGTLYYLRNWTRGTDERIFVYGDGRQRVW